MREELINECLELKAKILSQCNYLVEKEPSCENVIKIAIDNINAPQYSDSAIREMNEDELKTLIGKFNIILSKIEKTLDKVDDAIAKMNVSIVDEKKQKQELMIKAILNRLLYFRYRILNFFGIEIK